MVVDRAIVSFKVWFRVKVSVRPFLSASKPFKPKSE